MTSTSFVWGSPEWAAWALGLSGAAALVLLWGYLRARASGPVRACCAALKVVGFAALAVSLLEPLLAGTRPRRGANAFVVLADNSQSLLVRDDDSSRTRGDWLRERLRKDAPWATRLGQDFDVRRYAFDTHLRAVAGFDDLAFDGTGSSLNASLSALGRRFRGLPLAGVLLFTDGNQTDAGDVDWSRLPPVYPVLPPSRGAARDVGVSQVSVSQTNFEAAPAVVRADVAAIGFRGKTVVVTVTDEAGHEVARQRAEAGGDGKPLSFRFQFRPVRKGINFYRVNAFAAADEAALKAGGQEPAPSGEQTTANNSRLVVIDQGGGPYRVLYVGGRPGWEFKFLSRAVAEDEQVKLVGLVRVARRQPKFDFQDARNRPTSRLYQGFDQLDAESAERADEPVLKPVGDDLEEGELRDGFPKAADVLYRYHAVILDDVEAGFFTQDQLTLLRNFVSHRGGGLLMLGGPDSLAEGRYDRSPVGDLLPIYLSRGTAPGPAPADEPEYRLVLTREGWLQPWVRVRKTEDDERQRLAAMPPFRTLSRVGNAKPGAVVLAQVRDPAGNTAPALVAQQFGKGHAAALLVGDLWRWQMRRQDAAEDDFDRSWRQAVRWLVGDVPGHVDVSVRPRPGAAPTAVEVTVRVRDPEFRPLDNAKVALKFTLPGGEALTLDAAPDGREAGAYAATYVPKQPGAYRVVATATAPDGSTVGEREAGWAAQPAADEFARLLPDRDLLQSIAARTHGELVDGSRLDSFVASLPSRQAPITEPWTSPLWHHPLYFLVAIVCLAAEWGLRRVNGLA
jgi:uncharacterized membrane protein